jgi:hypothetical protein
MRDVGEDVAIGVGNAHGLAMMNGLLLTKTEDN